MSKTILIIIGSLGALIMTYLIFFVIPLRNITGGLCIQVVTKAINPITKKVREFSNPCYVPIGWREMNTASQADDENNQKISDQINKLADANNYFGINMLNKLDKDQKNLFISPFSLSMALTLAANGAVGDTVTEMKEVLGLNKLSMDSTNEQYQKMIYSLEKSADIKTDDIEKIDPPTFRIANSLWSDQGYAFLPSYTKLVKDYYQAEAQSLDFSDPNSLKTINQWVSDRTMGKIPKILNSLASNLYLINAIYFKSSWASPFLESATKDKQFYRENMQTKSVSMMQKTDDFLYSDDNGLQIVSIPYVGNNYSMVVFLPKKDTKIADFSKNLNPDRYNKYISGLKEQKVALILPKFEVNFGGSVLEEAQELGLKIATSGQAKFFKLSPVNMYINEIIHRTFIKTDEKGTEAAAATAVGFKVISTEEIIQPAEMIIDHPFLFAIQDNKTQSIIFLGIVRDPSDKGSQN